MSKLRPSIPFFKWSSGDNIYGQECWVLHVSWDCIMPQTVPAFFLTLLQSQSMDVQYMGCRYGIHILCHPLLYNVHMCDFQFLKTCGPILACTTGLCAVGTGLWTLGYADLIPTTGLGPGWWWILWVWQRWWQQLVQYLSWEHWHYITLF